MALRTWCNLCVLRVRLCSKLLTRNIIQNQIARSLFLFLARETGNAEFFACVLICGCKIHSTSREVRRSTGGEGQQGRCTDGFSCHPSSATYSEAQQASGGTSSSAARASAILVGVLVWRSP